MIQPGLRLEHHCSFLARNIRRTEFILLSSPQPQVRSPPWRPRPPCAARWRGCHALVGVSGRGGCLAWPEASVPQHHSDAQTSSQLAPTPAPLPVGISHRVARARISTAREWHGGLRDTLAGRLHHQSVPPASCGRSAQHGLGRLLGGRGATQSAPRTHCAPAVPRRWGGIGCWELAATRA